MIAVLLGGIAKGQWQQCNGPFGGYILSFASNSNYIFAGTNNGLFKTYNDGQSWVNVNNGISQKTISSIAIYGNKVFVGTPDSGLFVSSNFGSTWVNMNNLPNKRIASIVAKDSNLYVATYYAGVFYSKDTGSTWLSMNNSGLYPSIYLLALNDTAIFVGSQNGVYQTFNNGLTWEQASLPIPSVQITNIVIKGSKVVVSSGNGIFISDNNGVNWYAANNDTISHEVIYAVAVSDSFLYAGTIFSGIYRSSDNGLSWVQTNNILSNIQIYCLSIINNSLYAGTMGAGIYKSLDNGLNWSQISTGINTATINTMGGNGYNVYAADDYGSGINKSSDNGLNWIPINNGFSGSKKFRNIIAKDSNIFAIKNYDGICRSTDYGLNWSLSNNGIDSNSKATCIAFSGNNILAGDYWNGGIYISNDNGINWVLNTNNGIYTHLRVKSFASKNDTIYALTLSGLIQSTNGGLSWSYIYQPYTSEFQMGDICFSGGNIILIKYPMIYLPGTYNGWYAISNDNGNTWTDLSITPEYPYISSMASNNSFVFASTNLGVFLSTDNGYSWINISDNLINPNCLKVMINGNYLYVSIESGGIWRRALSDFVGIKENTQNNQLHLYPNPATNSLTLNLSQQQGLQNATVSIYDIQGKQLLQQNIVEPQTQIDISSFAKGIYIVKLQTDKEILQSKFVKE